jgi:type II secretory ATPase GspE/PulE/Tfp pilus assembly ATPase PilB-like protein
VRLVDLGIEPWIIANALSVVLAQRLVRVVCPACAQSEELGEDLIVDDELLCFAGTKVAVPRGCPQCRGTGYRGRTGIFEVLEVTDDMRDLIKNKATSQTYRELLRQRRIPSLRQVGIEKACAGITTIEEVLRVT